MDKKLLTIDVSHGTTHDGPGMRTTVFVKGCPLHCIWCQNPESILPRNAVWWNGVDCIGCRLCEQACPNQAARLRDDGLCIDRDFCKNCGMCAEACPTSAIQWQGQEYDIGTLVAEVSRDKNYYKQFGGGVTCSGGEPLLQYQFVSEFFERLHRIGITTALDTCGFAPRKNLDAVLPVTDYVLYDMKLFDAEAHMQYTGVSNQLILENLLYVADYIRNNNPNMKLWIRTPLIPRVTSTKENINAIGCFLRDKVADVMERWELCAFNGVCVSKYDKLGISWQFDGIGAMSDSEIEPIKILAESLLSREKVLISGMIRATK